MPVPKTGVLPLAYTPLEAATAEIARSESTGFAEPTASPFAVRDFSVFVE